MTDSPSLERLLRRDGAITIASLLVLWALTWAYLAAGAGLGMNAWEMTRLAFLPQPAGQQPMASMAGMDMAAMPGMGMEDLTPVWDPRYWALMVGMWWAMMIAMMTPSAAPAILLYARVHRHYQSSGDAQGQTPTGAFLAGYLLMWLLFSIAATALHQGLQQAGLISATSMASEVRWLSGTLLIVAGVYQWSPLKDSCLSHCRAPAEFLSRHWRPGASGALRLGLLHGGFCIGCCWMLMALLFVGGVMNLAWIAALSLLVLAEKLLAQGSWVGRVAGIVLIAWGAVVLLR